MTSFLAFLGHRGEILGDRYEIVDELGHGSFGVVWKARRLKDNELVALKIPHDQELGEASLRQETDLVRMFNHPNVVKIYDVLTISGWFVIEMELVDGYSLAHYLDGVGPQRPLSFEQILIWTRQILDGLSALHSGSVVHGDIKPQNILINREGQAKLVDFGTSRRLEDVLVWTKRQGTEPYWAPEVAFDEHRSLVSDVYSLGVVLYEMVTGQMPYKSPYELLAGRIVQRPREINPDIPLVLEQIIQRAMARKPEERYRNVGAMAADVDLAFTELHSAPIERTSERREPSRVGFRMDSSSPLFYLEEAKRYLGENNLHGALKAAEISVNRSGGHPTYLRLLGSIQLKLGYQRQAVETYEKLLAAYQGTYPGRADQFADVLQRLGKLYTDAKHYRKAIVVYEQLTDIEPDNNYFRFRLAAAYGLDGRYRKAITLLELVHRQFPDRAVVLSKLGWAHMAQGDIRAGLSYYNQALVLDPWDLLSLFELTRYHFITGDRRIAQGYLERLQKADRDRVYSERIKDFLESG
ncbi:MAG: protein kinase [Anaerolineaceae bacterium]|nr:protein kinase [Anaerolineaceae bacterium]